MKTMQQKIRIFIVGLFLVSGVTATYFFVTHLRNQVTICLATADDVPFVQDVLTRTIKASCAGFMGSKYFYELLSTRVIANSLKRFRKAIDDEKSRIHVAKVRGKVIGYVYTYKINDTMLFVDNLFVLPEYHRRGLGKILMNANLKSFHDADHRIKNVLVHVRHKNLPALEFYRKLGFMKIEEQPEGDYIMYTMLKVLDEYS